MKSFPSMPRLADAPPELLDSGHLWLQEKVDGANFRFRLQSNGVVQFGDRSNTYETDDIPAPYQHVVRHVRHRFDRDALRAAVDDVSAIVFFGEAMHRHAIDYDWERTPSFLGFDVWSATEERFLPPDAVESIYDRLGLESVNAVRKELPARDFQPDVEAIPESNWYDGPAEGLIVRDKTGHRAKLLHPEFREVDDTVPLDADAAQLARRYATDRRFEKLARKLENREIAVTFDTLYDRVLDDIVREAHKQLFHGDSDVDRQAFRSTVAARTREFVSGND